MCGVPLCVFGHLLCGCVSCVSSFLWDLSGPGFFLDLVGWYGVVWCDCVVLSLGLGMGVVQAGDLYGLY